MNNNSAETESRLKELENIKNSYNYIINNSSNAIIILQNEKVVFANKKASDASGYSIEDLKTGPFIDMIYHEDKNFVMQNYINRLQDKEAPVNYTIRLTHKKGYLIWVEVDSLLFSWNGRPAILCFITDITEKKKIEFEIEQQNKKILLFNKLNDAVNKGFSLKDVVGVFSKGTEEIFPSIYVSLHLVDEKKKRLYMYEYLQPDTKKNIEHIAGTAIPEIETIIEKKGLLDEIIKEREIKILDTSDKIIQLLKEFALNNVALKNSGKKNSNLFFNHISDVYNFINIITLVNIPLIADNKCIGLLLISSREILPKEKIFEMESVSKQFTAILNHKLSEEKLKESEERYKNLFESSPEAIFIADIETGLIFDTNPAALKLLKKQKNEIVGVHQKFIHPPRIRKNIKKTFIEHTEEVKKYGKGRMHESFVYTSDKKEIPVEINVQRINLKGKDYIQGVFRDISERKKAEKSHKESEENFRKLMKEQIRAQLAEENSFRLMKEVSSRKKAEEELKHSLKEKEILLKEVHHRVKNNLQIILSILNLQIRNISGKDLYQTFFDCRDRVKSIALIHDDLYKSKDLNCINFDSYVKNITDNLFRTYGIKKTGNIHKKFSIDKVFFSMDMAVPCGLIINELISNSLKYAFANKNKGIIFVGLKKKNKKHTLTISDNGKGIEKTDLSKTKSLGLQIVYTLVEQLNGNIKLDNKNGTKYIINF